MQFEKSARAASLLGLLAVGACAEAAPRTSADWERCRDRAEASVDRAQEGVAGAEAAILARCGAPPPKEAGTAQGVGVHPYDLVRSKAWKKKFAALAKGKYRDFVARLVVAGDTRLDGDWIVGDGQAPHLGGSDEAALAIEVKTGKVFGALLEDGETLTGFGFGPSWENAPPYLQNWAKNHKN